ncbi:hypothetical protein HDU81_001147, partial [Chytriomyces hyalinus]
MNETEEPSTKPPEEQASQLKLPEVQISTGNSLMNEFEDMHTIIYGLMPFKFLLSQGVELTASGKASHLKKANMFHACHQPHALIENDIDFICYTCNVTKWHAGIQKCSILAKAQTSHFTEFN